MKFSLNHILKILVLVFLCVGGFILAKEFLLPICIAVILGSLFLPFCKKLESIKIPKGIAALICILTFIIVVSAIITLLGWQISDLMSDLSLLKERLIETANQLQAYLFNHLGISNEKQRQIIQNEQPKVSLMVVFVLGSISTLITNLVLILAYMFIFLFYRSHFKQFILMLVKGKDRVEIEEIILNITKVSQQYLLGLAKMIACLWIMYGIGFSIIGIKHVIFFAILCGLLEIIPYIGNMTGTLFTVLITAVQGGEAPLLLSIVLVYGIVQFIQGWVLEPIILGPQVKINPFVTILALVLGELLWGVAGMFIAIPVTAILKILFDHVKSLKPIGFLMGEPT